MKIAVIGALGFVGSAIASIIESDVRYKLISIVRGDDIKSKLESADVVIHAANPARRYRAESDPQHDFIETADKTFRILSLANEKKCLLISSLSCKTQLNTNYGRNRRFCELLALGQSAVVIRLGPMFGGTRKQDVLHDLLADRQIYVSPETRYAYVDIKWVGAKILELLEVRSDIYEIGAHNSVALAELRDYFGSKSVFTGPNDTQIPELKGEGPDAMLVVKYARKELLSIDSWK
jgi:nucleoside-diphosphate-sugar epimerase